MTAAGPTATAARPTRARRAAALRHRGLGRRRQVDADRAAALRLQGDLRRPARARRGGVERRRGDDGYVDLALLTDGLRAEREQGITIDVAYRYFATPRRKFIIADTPGHVQYTRNMVTGRVDRRPRDRARRRAQGRRRAVAPPRVHRLAAAASRTSSSRVNKMDLVDYDEAVFDRDRRRVPRVRGASSTSPTSRSSRSRALHGDNVVERSTNMPWYGGPPLLYHLEHVHIASDRNLIDAASRSSGSSAR